MDGNAGGIIFILFMFILSIAWGIWDTFTANRKKKRYFKRKDTIFLESKLSEILEKQSKESKYLETSHNLRAFRATALARGLELNKLKRDTKEVFKYLYEESAYKEIIAEDDTLSTMASKVV